MAKSAVKFRDTVAAYDRIAGEIRAGRFAPVYLLMVEESYFIDRLAEQRAASILHKAERDFNQIVDYDKDSALRQLYNLFR